MDRLDDLIENVMFRERAVKALEYAQQFLKDEYLDPDKRTMPEERYAAEFETIELRLRTAYLSLAESERRAGDEAQRMANGDAVQAVHLVRARTQDALQRREDALKRLSDDRVYFNERNDERSRDDKDYDRDR